MTREVADYVHDVIDSIGKSAKFIEGIEYESFIRDDKTVFAVLRALEVMGEAIKNIPEDVRRKYPEIPWKDMAGMRDKLIHAYFGVDLRRVWKTAKEEIPPLKPVFERIKNDQVRERDTHF